MTRASWVAATCVVFAAAPAAAQQTGSVGIQGGLSASGPALAGSANLLAEFGSFGVGPEVGVSGLGDGANAWHVGAAFELAATAGKIRPHGAVGVARYSWKTCGDCASLGLLGISLAAGASLVHSTSGLSLETDLRWHRQLQSIGAPEAMSFVTVTLGPALHW
jgi:hypothetical protein